MEAVILIGIQGSGKTTFYQQTFSSTHLRISLDQAATRSRETRLMERCFAGKLDFVIDNTNATADQRTRYTKLAKAHGYRVVGYYFPPDVKEALRRNSLRVGKAKVPVPGIYSTLKRLQPPSMNEGFDELFLVTIAPCGEFKVASS